MLADGLQTVQRQIKVEVMMLNTGIPLHTIINVDINEHDAGTSSNVNIISR